MTSASDNDATDPLRRRAHDSRGGFTARWDGGPVPESLGYRGIVALAAFFWSGESMTAVDLWWIESGQAEIARILVQVWDVIGVRDLDEDPAAEYLGEAQELERVIRSGGDAAIAARLGEFAEELSQERDRGRDRRDADAIVRWLSSRPQARSQ